MASSVLNLKRLNRFVLKIYPFLEDRCLAIRPTKIAHATICSDLKRRLLGFNIKDYPAVEPPISVLQKVWNRNSGRY
jgi:hypothetical protein